MLFLKKKKELCIPSYYTFYAYLYVCIMCMFVCLHVCIHMSVCSYTCVLAKFSAIESTQGHIYYTFYSYYYILIFVIYYLGQCVYHTHSQLLSSLLLSNPDCGDHITYTHTHTQIYIVPS